MSQQQRFVAAKSQATGRISAGLVEQDEDGARRQRLLETVRQYARERLVQSGEAERMRDRHLSAFLDLATRAEPELTKADQVGWLNRLDVERDNLRVALEWSLGGPALGGQCALELAASLFWFWVKRGYFAEGQLWLERALAAAPSPRGPLHAKGLVALGQITFFQGDFARARALLAESAALARAAGDVSIADAISVSTSG